MAEGQSMTTAADVVWQVRDGRPENFVCESGVLVTRKLMEAEITAEVWCPSSCDLNSSSSGAPSGSARWRRTGSDPPSRTRQSHGNAISGAPSLFTCDAPRSF
jgi:hypothetical protein